MDLQIRRMQQWDIDRVCEIEGKAFSMPWSREAFQEMVSRNDSIYLVALEDSEVVGCAGMTNTLGEGYINNVVVDENYRQRGIAGAMLKQLMKDGYASGVEEWTLEVRVSNKGAIALYESTGFVSEGTRKRFYEKPVEDAYVMWKRKSQ